LKVSDIYNRGGGTKRGPKSQLNTTGQNIKQQIYDYIRDNQIKKQDLEFELKSLKASAINFLTRLFSIEALGVETKEELLESITKRIYSESDLILISPEDSMEQKQIIREKLKRKIYDSGSFLDETL
jgi:hypothetical protein